MLNDRNRADVGNLLIVRHQLGWRFFGENWELWIGQYQKSYCAVNVCVCVHMLTLLGGIYRAVERQIDSIESSISRPSERNVSLN